MLKERKRWIGVCINLGDRRKEIFRECIFSLLRQNLPPQKVIIFADEKLLPEIPKIFLEKVEIHEPYGTQASMRNLAVKKNLNLADFFVFVSPDVVLLPFSVEKLLSAVGQNIKVAVLWGKQIYQGESEGERSFFKLRFPEKRFSLCSPEDVPVLSPSSIATTSWCAVSKKALKACGFFPDIRIGEDGAFLLKSLLEGFCSFYVPKALAIHFQREDSKYLFQRAKNEVQFLCILKKDKSLRQYFENKQEYVFYLFLKTLFRGLIKVSLSAGFKPSGLKSLFLRFSGALLSKCIFSDFVVKGKEVFKR